MSGGVNWWDEGQGGMSNHRTKHAPSAAWQALQAQLLYPEQEAYEEIRPVITFGQEIKERAAEIGISPKTLSHKVDLFIQHGIPGLVPGGLRRADDRRQLPTELREYLLQLKAEYPAFTSREIVDILDVKFDRTVSHHTVEQTITRGTLPKIVGRRYPRYAKMRDAEERREAMLRLHLEGWSTKAIIGYLGAPRRTVQAFLTRWVADGVQSLQGKQAGRPPGIRKVTLPVMATIKEQQETSAVGEFRMSAYLKQHHGIDLSPRTCGRVMAANRDLYGLVKETPAPLPKKPMPFAANVPHQYWSVDICYIEHHHLPDQAGPFYIITVLDNYSRKIVASAPSRTQDLWAFLMVLCTAISIYGAPAALVSDGGAVFRAHAATQIYETLHIEKLQIERRKPWQDYCETHFRVMKLMERYRLEEATSWQEVCAVHARFVVDYNHQEHFAHLDREDGKHTPSDVMGWVQGHLVTTPTLQELFNLVYATRTLDRSGYIRYQTWRIYGEEGLAGRRANVWVMKETHTLTIAYQQEPLAEYQVEYAPNHLTQHNQHPWANLTELRQFPTQFPAPPRLWDQQQMNQVEWRKVYRVPHTTPRRKALPPPVIQLPLLFA